MFISTKSFLRNPKHIDEFLLLNANHNQYFQAQQEYIEAEGISTIDHNVYNSNFNFIGVKATLRFSINNQLMQSDPHISPLLAQNFVNYAEYLERLTNFVENETSVDKINVKMVILKNGAFDLFVRPPMLKYLLASFFTKRPVYRRQFKGKKSIGFLFTKRKFFLDVSEFFKIFLQSQSVKLQTKHKVSTIFSSIKAFRLYIINCS